MQEAVSQQRGYSLFFVVSESNPVSVLFNNLHNNSRNIKHYRLVLVKTRYQKNDSFNGRLYFK